GGIALRVGRQRLLGPGVQGRQRELALRRAGGGLCGSLHLARLELSLLLADASVSFSARHHAPRAHPAPSRVRWWDDIVAGGAAHGAHAPTWTYIVSAVGGARAALAAHRTCAGGLVAGSVRGPAAAGEESGTLLRLLLVRLLLPRRR